MDYEVLENEIVNKFQAWLTERSLTDFIDVKLIPENQAEFKQPTAKALVYVCYTGSKYQDPNSTSHIKQDEIVNVAFYILAKKLRGDGGSHQVTRQLKLCFMGYMPTNATRRMFISGYGEWKYEDNVIGPMIEFGMGAMNVQLPDNLPPV